MSETVAMEDLFAALVQAKQREQEAKVHRLACEARILETIADKPEKGRVKLKGGPVTASVEFKLNYSADVDSIRGGMTGDELPIRLVPASYEFDEKAYESLRTKNPALFAQVSKFVTTKPAKPSIELKL